MQNFWEQLDKPIWMLAPMYDVTDFAFREMFARYGKPSAMVTEFVSVDGLLSEKGQEHLLQYLEFSNSHRPILAQIWGVDPAKFEQAAKLVASLGFDGIDINMGCPQESEIKIGACAALIQNPKLSQDIILATKRGAGELPVSVKTRLGYNHVETEAWIGALLAVEPAAIAIHGRTKKEKSKVPAQWNEIAKAVILRNQLQSQTLIIGNGDIHSKLAGEQRILETGVDGVMVGRGAFGNPFFFSAHQPSHVEKLRVMVEHAELFEQHYAGKKPFMIMRKHFKAYANGFPGAAELRAKLMETENADEVKQLVDAFL